MFHCNRATVALKLGQYEIAVQDALQAVKQDASYAQAYVRAAEGACGFIFLFIFEV